MDRRLAQWSRMPSVNMNIVASAFCFVLTLLFPTVSNSSHLVSGPNLQLGGTAPKHKALCCHHHVRYVCGTHPLKLCLNILTLLHQTIVQFYTCLGDVYFWHGVRNKNKFDMSDLKVKERKSLNRHHKRWRSASFVCGIDSPSWLETKSICSHVLRTWPFYVK